MQLPMLKQLAALLACTAILGSVPADARSAKAHVIARAHEERAKEIANNALDSSMTPRPAFYLIGDSITEYSSSVDSHGWGARLQETYVRTVDVINRGLCSYNTTKVIDVALPRLKEEIGKQFKPVLITLWLGTNDAAHIDGPSGFQHVPVSQYAENLQSLVKNFTALVPTAKILVITPGVVDDVAIAQAALNYNSKVHRSNAQSKIYAQACVKAVTGLPEVTVIDLYTELMTRYPDAAERAGLLADGLHLSAKGNDVVYNLISQKISSLFQSTLLKIPQFPYVA